MGNNKLKKSLALVTAFSIAISGDSIPQIKARASVKNTDINITKQYIIIAGSQYAYNAVMSEYNDEIQDTGDTPILAEKSIMIADLTEEEARQLACEEGIICVEEDFEVKGCSENETNSLPDNIPEQWNLDVINADNQQYKLGNDTVKIAIMDSGITIDSQYSVEERINFVPGDDGLEPLYDLQ